MTFRAPPCSSVYWSFVPLFISGTKRDDVLKSKKALFHFWSDNWSTLTFLRNKNSMGDRINKLGFQVPQVVCGRNAVSFTSVFNNIPYRVNYFTIITFRIAVSAKDCSKISYIWRQLIHIACLYEIIQQNGVKIAIDKTTSPLKYQTSSKLYLKTSVSIGGYGHIASVVAWRLAG